jgi:hypothetical protein
LPKPPGWLSLRTIEDEINHILSRAESKFCTPNGGVCTSKTVGVKCPRLLDQSQCEFSVDSWVQRG